MMALTHMCYILYNYHMSRTCLAQIVGITRVISVLRRLYTEDYYIIKGTISRTTLLMISYTCSGGQGAMYRFSTEH